MALPARASGCAAGSTAIHSSCPSGHTCRPGAAFNTTPTSTVPAASRVATSSSEASSDTTSMVTGLWTETSG
ncbi:hypothetical protein G6F54_014433 [Rhizopus delemar]|nr:hypothetical protein G6F54_014433 [Rhizopus delemar]